MQRKKGWRALVALSAVALLAAGCGDDDDGGSASGSPSGSASEPAEDEGASTDVEGSATVEIDMVDYGYEVSGPLATGVQTFTTTNRGEEIHMMGLGKMKEGITIDDVVAALSESGEEGGSEERPEEDAETEDGATEDEAQAGDGDGGEGGEEGGDPFAALFDGEIGTPGHLLTPGTTQSLTLEDDLDVGTYALICFIPTEGDGAPHFAKGMIQELEVVEGGASGELPEPDATYSLPDGAEPDGPAELEAGEVTLKITNDGEIGKDFVVANLDEGEDFESFDQFFVEEYEAEGGPSEGAASRAPGAIAGSTFELAAGQTIYLTVDLEPGTWLIVSTNNAESDESGESEDFILEVTVA